MFQLAIQGSSPGFRAGHAAVNIGSKARTPTRRNESVDSVECISKRIFFSCFLVALQVYVIGGVGDKQYYSDVWVLDLLTCYWTQLDICGQQPHGRFSHSAVVADSDIVIYGG